MYVDDEPVLTASAAPADGEAAARRKKRTQWALAAGCGILVLVCGIGVVASKVAAGRRVSVSRDPDEVRADTRAMSGVEIPPGFQPIVSVKHRATASGDVHLQWVGWENRTIAGQLVVFRASRATAPGATDETRQEELARSLLEHDFLVDATKWVYEPRETKTVEVRGRQAEFQVAVGRRPGSQAARLRVTGGVAEDGGLAGLILCADAAKFGDAGIDRLIGSIR